MTVDWTENSTYWCTSRYEFRHVSGLADATDNLPGLLGRAHGGSRYDPETGPFLIVRLNRREPVDMDSAEYRAACHGAGAHSTHVTRDYAHEDLAAACDRVVASQVVRESPLVVHVSLNPDEFWP